MWGQCLQGWTLWVGAVEDDLVQDMKSPSPSLSAPPMPRPDPRRNVLTFHQEGPVTGHLASDVGGYAAVAPAVPGLGSQQAEVMGPTIFVDLNGAFSSPHGDTFQEPGHLGLWDP